MDALALLCTLHADGPRTTRRLRQMGVHDLDQLEKVPVSTLAEVLDSSQKAGERFLREASILKKRVRHEAVDDSPPKRGTPEPAAPPAERASPAVAQAPAPAARAEASSARPKTAAPANGADEAPEEPEQPEQEELRRFVIHPRMREIAGPLEVRSDADEDSRHPSSGAGRVLRPGLFEGLDTVACTRLRSAGVETAEELATASGLDLALELGWPYDRVFHLKKEASHFLQSLGTAREVPASRAIEDEGASGPFA